MKNENKYHSHAIDELLSLFKTDVTKGLDSNEVKIRLEKYGENKISETKRISVFMLLFKQLNNPMSYLLIIAVILSFSFNELLDGTAIIFVIILNMLIGFWMEWQAEKSMDSLKKMVEVTAKVLRDGSISEIPSRYIVPGDILILEAGDMISADGRLLEGFQLQTNEGALTGESMPVEKVEGILPEDELLAERKNMLYKGTFVSKGNGKMLVVATGMQTELGKIAGMVQVSKQAATPLERKLLIFSKKLIIITVVLVFLLFGIGLINQYDWRELIKTSISLAVAAIPEGLPIVATLALAQGMVKMARHQVIVKKLSSVETLGGTSVICTDKTGTLTQNKIEVETVDLSGKENLTYSESNPENKSILTSNSSYDKLVLISVLCNTAVIGNGNSNNGFIGDALEIGLLEYAVKNDFDIGKYRDAYPKLKEEPFTSDTRIMATLHRVDTVNFVSVKGAVEEILNSCEFYEVDGLKVPFTEEKKKYWLQRNDELAQKGLRVLAFAWKETDEDGVLTNDLIFTGFIGFIDPPATGVKEAIDECRKAGIKIIMITGDHPATALTIARQLSLIDENDSRVLNGKDMSDRDNLSPDEKKKWLDTRVFARVSPRQKLDLVSILQEDNNIVGMTGDGVNDAPALKKSDIGIAMGIRGTQVAQEAADMILKDDSFTSIVHAIEQGRAIFENIRKFVIYLLSCNLSELLVVSLVYIFNLHFQLYPLQILFINLITDVLPALALGMTKGGSGIMLRKPRHLSEPIITPRQWKSLWLYAILMTFFTFLPVYFSHYILHPSEPWNKELCNNILFLTLIACQLIHVFNMSSERVIFYKNEVFSNKYIWYALVACTLIIFSAFLFAPLEKVLHLYKPSIADWILVFSSAIAFLVTIQILKKFNWIE